MLNHPPDINSDPVGYCVWGLKYGNAIERGNAADMLRSCGVAAETAIPVLIQLLRHDQVANVRSQCAFALMEISYSLHEKMQIAVVPLLEALQQDQDFEVRSLAAEALGEIAPGDQEVISVLEKALLYPHEWVRKSAQEALDRIRN